MTETRDLRPSSSQLGGKSSFDGFGSIHAFTFSKLTIETLHQCVKSVQSQL